MLSQATSRLNMTAEHIPYYTVINGHVYPDTWTARTCYSLALLSSDSLHHFIPSFPNIRFHTLGESQTPWMLACQKIPCYVHIWPRGWCHWQNFGWFWSWDDLHDTRPVRMHLSQGRKRILSQEFAGLIEGALNFKPLKGERSKIRLAWDGMPIFEGLGASKTLQSAPRWAGYAGAPGKLPS